MRLYRDKRIMEFFREAGRRGGLIGGAEGGRLAASRMTKAERIARAKKGAAASARVRSAKVKARLKKEKLRPSK